MTKDDSCMHDPTPGLGLKEREATGWCGERLNSGAWCMHSAHTVHSACNSLGCKAGGGPALACGEMGCAPRQNVVNPRLPCPRYGTVRPLYPLDLSLHRRWCPSASHRLCPSSSSLPYLSLSTSLSFPLVGCANGAPGLSLFHCSVSGSTRMRATVLAVGLWTGRILCAALKPV